MTLVPKNLSAADSIRVPLFFHFRQTGKGRQQGRDAGKSGCPKDDLPVYLRDRSGGRQKGYRRLRHCF